MGSAKSLNMMETGLYGQRNLQPAEIRGETRMNLF